MGKIINIDSHQEMSELTEPTTEVSSLLRCEESSDNSAFVSEYRLPPQTRKKNQGTKVTSMAKKQRLLANKKVDSQLQTKHLLYKVMDTQQKEIMLLCQILEWFEKQIEEILHDINYIHEDINETMIESFTPSDTLTRMCIP